jgi:hypothetical protein
VQAVDSFGFVSAVDILLVEVAVGGILEVVMD